MVTHFMLSNKVGAFVFLTCFFFSCTAQTISCPEQIKTNSTLLDKNPEWEAVGISYPQYFEQISLTSGHPDEQATLVPDIENKKHIGWSLSAGGDGETGWSPLGGSHPSAGASRRDHPRGAAGSDQRACPGRGAQ